MKLGLFTLTGRIFIILIFGLAASSYITIDYIIISEGNIKSILDGLFVLIVICLYWIIYGFLNREVYILNNWRRQIGGAFLILLIMGWLYVERHNTPLNSKSRLLLDMTFYLMLFGGIITDNLLKAYARTKQNIINNHVSKDGSQIQ